MALKISKINVNKFEGATFLNNQNEYLKILLRIFLDIRK